METTRNGNIITMTMTYEEWTSNPFPQPSPLLLGETFEYIVECDNHTQRDEVRKHILNKNK